MVLGIFIFIFVIKIPPLSSQENDWIGFFGSLIGAAISGLVTFIALKITIDHENQKRQKDKEIEDDRQIADRQMGVYPSLVYSINDLNKDSEETLPSELITPQNLMQSLRPGDEIHPDFSFGFYMTNLGLGPAIKLNLKETYFDNKRELCVHLYNYSVLNIRQTAYISIGVKWPNIDLHINPAQLPPELGVLKLKIAYENILQDIYEQEIEILLNRCLKQTKKNGEVVKEEVLYQNPIIRKVTKPKII